MYGHQIRIMTNIMFQVSVFILNKKWEELYNTVEVDCTKEEIECEINDYPDELCECEISDFFDGTSFEAIDGYKTIAVADFWADGEESDLSMEFEFDFSGKELKKVTLKGVHVY